jgi:hypothetical protein
VRALRFELIDLIGEVGKLRSASGDWHVRSSKKPLPLIHAMNEDQEFSRELTRMIAN